MAKRTLRVGLIGAGANTRLRHIPGLRALPDVDIVAVCNRRAESTAAAAREFGIARTFEHWQDLVRDPVGRMRALYEGLELGGFEDVRPGIEKYLAEHTGYQTNRYPALSDELRGEIARRWGPVIDRYGYSETPS